MFSGRFLCRTTILARSRETKRYSASENEDFCEDFWEDFCEDTDAVSWFLSASLDRDDKDLFLPSILSDKSDLSHLLCSFKFVSLSSTTGSTRGCDSFRRFLPEQISSDSHFRFLPLTCTEFIRFVEAVECC